MSKRRNLSAQVCVGLVQPKKQEPTLLLLIILSFPRIRFLFIGQAGKVIHAGVEGHGQLPTLLKGHVSLSVLDFRVIALVNPGCHLHHKLRHFSFDTQFL